MLSFDPKNKAVSSSSLKKTANKGRSSKSEFMKGVKPKEVSISDVQDIANITPMVFLQEIDVYQDDKDNLADFSKNALKQLKQLQLSLADGQINENILHNLRNTLNSNKHKFSIPEIKNLMEEIETRICVEIAKIEVSKK